MQNSACLQVHAENNRLLKFVVITLVLQYAGELEFPVYLNQTNTFNNSIPHEGEVL